EGRIPPLIRGHQHRLLPPAFGDQAHDEVLAAGVEPIDAAHAYDQMVRERRLDEALGLELVLAVDLDGRRLGVGRVRAGGAVEEIVGREVHESRPDRARGLGDVAGADDVHAVRLVDLRLATIDVRLRRRVDDQLRAQPADELVDRRTVGDVELDEAVGGCPAVGADRVRAEGLQELAADEAGGADDEDRHGEGASPSAQRRSGLTWAVSRRWRSCWRRTRWRPSKSARSSLHWRNAS